MSKLTYWNRDSNQKRVIRKFLLNKIRERGFNKIVTLAGPDIIRSTAHLIKLGFTEITTYEKNRKIAERQLLQLNKIKHIYGDTLKLSIKSGDVLNHDNSSASALYEEVFYDLDFCARIESVKQHILKFCRPFATGFMITVSEQRVNTFSTIPKFLKIIGAKEERRILPNASQALVKTNLGNYMFTRYCDTSPMVIISPVVIISQ